MTNNGNSSPRPPSVEIAAEKAIQLFNIVEELQVPCGYERSFKMLDHTLLANRFLLGINTKDIADSRLLEACRKIEMPEPYLQLLRKHLPESNNVFLGFEDFGEGSLYKVYLEFWDKVTYSMRGQTDPKQPALLHLGFKWNASNHSQEAISRYVCYPLLSVDEILERLQSIYSGDTSNHSLAIARDIIAFAGSRYSDRSFIYLEVSEEDHPRKSFDINLYKARIHLREIGAQLSRMRTHYSIPDERFDRLYRLVEDKLLGHLAGGLNRNGEDFLTVYYEM